METPSTVELDLKNRTAKITGNDIVTVMTCLLVMGIAAFTGMHYMDSKEGRAEFIAALKEQAKATNDLGAATKEQNCLLVHRQRFKPEEYQLLADFCRSAR